MSALKAPTCDLDVLVVGAGPVGLTAALELVRGGIPVDRIRIIDKATKPAHLAKASSLWPRTLELLRTNHPRALEEIEGNAMKISSLGVYEHDGETGSSVHLTSLDIAGNVPDCQFQHMYTIPQYQTEQILRDELEKVRGVKVEYGVELVNFQEVVGCVKISLRNAQTRENENISAQYIVGCDGAHSQVRHLLGLDFPGDTNTDQRFLIAHCRLEGVDASSFGSNKKDELFVMIGHEHALGMVVPFQDGTAEIILSVNEEAALKTFGVKNRDPTLEEFQAVVRTALDKRAVVKDAQWLGLFRINSRQIERYSSGRAFMCGDACHVHSPLGGQGMNYGMQDAFNLSWKLAMVAQGQASPSLLDSYHAERKPAGAALLAMTETQTGGILKASALRNKYSSFDTALLAVIHAAQRHGVMSAVGRGILVPFLSQASIKYKASPLSCEHWELETPRPNLRRMLHRRQVALTRFFRTRVVAGARAPDVPLVTPRGNATRLHGLLNAAAAGNRFTVLLFEAAKGYHDDKQWHGGQDTDLQALQWELSILCGNDRVHIETIGAEEVAAQQAFGVWGQCLFVVRPDGYIGLRSQPASRTAVVRYLVSRVGMRSVEQSMPDDWSAQGQRMDRLSAAASNTNMLLVLTSVLLVGNLAAQLYFGFRRDGGR